MTTYCFNIKTKSLSSYTNYPFNSFALLNGVLIGASKFGLDILTGLTDNGRYINSRIRLPILDLHSNNVQKLSHIWINGWGEMEAIIKNEHEHEFTYYPDRIGPQSHRIKIGKGLRGRHITIELSNNLGDSFSIRTITVFTDRPEEKRR